MSPTRNSRIVVARARTALLAGVLALWSMPALAQAGRPERLSDKDVKTLIDQVDQGRDKFEGNLDGSFKGSTLRGPTGEVKVSGALQDYQDIPRNSRTASPATTPPAPRWPPSSNSRRPSIASCRAPRAT